MALFQTVFAKDMVIDDDEFVTASNRLTTLAERIEGLRTDITSCLDDLRAGFDTPAGRKFFAACDNKLLEPMKDQAIVINHVSENLALARSAYSTVFQEFSILNNSIRNIQNN
jgi:hypothetical protein